MNKKKCPICKKPLKSKDNPFRPFCSERCKLVDLEGWLSGRYYVQGKKTTKADDVKENKRK